jgi:plastocyanin
MRHQIALAMIATVLAAGCAATGAGGAVGEADEVPTSPDTELEPGSDETGATAGPTEKSATSDEDAATDDPDEDAASASTVTIGDFFFEPNMLAVQVGDTVTWTHQGDITHNVTARDGSFVSENIASGETFTHTFAEAGSFEYRCTLHGQMLASIDVS